VVVTRDGVPAAVMVSPQEYDLIQALNDEVAEYHRLLADAAEQRYLKGEALDGDKVVTWLDQRHQEQYGTLAPNLEDIGDVADYLTVRAS